MKTHSRLNAKSRWVKFLALVSAFLMATNALWQAFGGPLDWARDSVVGDKLSPGSEAKPPRLEAPIKINVRAPIDRPTSSMSVTTLQPGKTYRLEIRGKYVWFTPNNGADGECSQYQSINDTTWQQNRLGAASPVFTGGIRTRKGSKLDDNRLDDAHVDDPFDVYVNGNEMNWQPVIDTGGGCNSRTNTYFADFTPDAPTRLSFHVFDPFNRNTMACVIDQTGSCAPEGENFVAVIYEGPKPISQPGETLVESILIDPRSTKQPPEVRTVNDLHRDRVYRFVASGTYTVATFPGYIGDAECGTVDHDDNKWQAHRWDFEGSGITDDIGDVYINGTEVDWEPRWNTNGKGCNVYDHSYYYLYQSRETRKGRFLLKGDHHLLNEGLIKIDIYSKPDVGAGSDLPSEAEDVPLPGSQPGETPPWSGSECVIGSNGFVSIPCSVQVSAASRSGVSVPLPAGNYRLQSVGTYTWHAPSKSFADAECAQWQVVPQVNDPTWVASRFNGLAPMFGGSGSDDPLDLYVGGRSVDWVPVSDSGGGCNAVDHAYDYVHSHMNATSLNFKIYDPVNANRLAEGHLTVRIMPGPEVGATADDLLVSTVVLNPKTSLSGTTGVSLPKGKLHRVVVSGTYKAGHHELDAECSSASGAAWAAAGFGPTEDTGDVLIDGVPRQWVPLEDTGGGCNVASHEYRFDLLPKTTAPVSFKLRLDPNLQYEGFLVIKVYALGDGARI